MGTMNKLRENTGVILWILVLSFGVIWVLQDSGAFDYMGSAAGQNIIVVDGDPVSYEDFVRAVDQQVQQYQEQTGETMPPQMADQVREQVYNAIVEDKLREHEMDRLGITVTDEEIYNMVLGPNPHQIIRVYFGDGEGGVNRALLQNFIDNPEARADWIQIEEYLRAERRREKLDNLIAATVHVSEQDVRDEHVRRSRRVDAEYVALPYAAVPDEDVEVTERDLERFYDDHRDEFRRERTFTLTYVTASKEPTATDSANVRQELERLRPRFAEAEDDSAFIMQNASERPYTNTWFTAAELEDELATVLFSQNPTPGQLVGPVFAGGAGHLVKVQDARAAEDVSVRARHILLRASGEDEDVRQRAQELRQQVRDGADFGDLARQASEDPGSARSGGDLGWFGPGAMVPEFEEAAFDAAVGEIVGPVRTSYGYHLIQVTARADREVKLADYAMEVRADVGTLNETQERLEDLRYFADETGDFEAEAERLGFTIEQVQFEDGQGFIPGLGTSRRVQNFLETAEEEAISEVIELDDVFTVVQVEEITEAGYRPFEAVRSELEPRVLKQKKATVQAERLRAAGAGDDLSALAEAVGAQVRTAGGVTFNTQIVPGLGREPRFTGTVLGLDEGETSDVVEGENAVFVARATSITEAPELSEVQRRQIREQLQQQRQAQLRNQWLTSLRDEAEVEDYRYRFQQ